MKAVAYMLDINAWSIFAGDKADYAIGGPTVEMLMKSYSQKYNVDYRTQATNDTGYQISKDRGVNWEDYYSGIFNTSDSLYIINSTKRANAMWLASPSAHAADNVMYANYFGGVGNNGGNNIYGFRPVVCLKSDVKLEKNADGNYVIQDKIQNNSVTFTYSKKGWTNEKITVTASTEVEGYSIQTSKDGEKWTNTESQEFTENGTMYVRLWDGTNYGGVASATVDNIDTTNPTINTELHSTNQTSNSITVSMNVQDMSSGISKIVWYYKAPESITSSNTTDEYTEMNGIAAGARTEETKEKTISNLASGITYSIYAVVYDVAGNSTTSNTINISTKTIPDLATGEDGEEGNVTFTYSTEEWTNGTVIATANTTITEYTLQTSKDRENWSTAASQTFTENGTIYARLTDGINYGGIVSENINNIDKTAPIVTNSNGQDNNTLYFVSRSTNSVDVEMYVQDTQSGLSKIIWYYKESTSTADYLKETTTYTGQKTLEHAEFKISNLLAGTTYSMYAEVYDAVGNKTTTSTRTIDTVSMPGLTTGENGNVTFTSNPEGWTRGNVTVAVETTVTGYTLETSKDGNNWTTETNQEFTENGTIYARLTDGINYGEKASKRITNIDRQEPQIGTFSYSAVDCTTVNLTLASGTDTQSKISKIIWYYREATATTDYIKQTTTYTTPVSEIPENDRTKQISNIKYNTNYSAYVEVYDAVGNVATSQEITTVKGNSTHNPTTGGAQKTEATCTNPAVYYQRCSRCSTQLTTTYESPYPVASVLAREPP